MIDQGIVMLINSGISSPPSIDGGFFVELPKDQKLPSWSYRTISHKTDTTLTSSVGLSTKRMQIDCYGNSASQAIDLAAEIDGILDGYQGILPDPDLTFVSCCFQSDLMDFFEDAPRNFRRMLEYEIMYSQS